MNQKISTKLGIAIIIIIAITIGIFMWEYERSQSESGQLAQINIPSKEVIGNITSYKNGSYGYEIEIPLDFSVKTGSLKDPDSLVNITSNQDNIPLFSIKAEISEFKDINTWLNDYQHKLAKINSYEGVKINPPTISSKEKVNIDGVEAIKINLRGMPYSDSLIAIIKDNFIYTISYNGLLLTNEKNISEGQSNNKENIHFEFQLKHREELDKMMESFKFSNDKIEEVSFCGKIFNTEIIYLNNTDVVKRIAILS